MATNNERQMHAATALYVPPRDCCDLTEFRAEEWATGHLCISRTYVPRHAPSLSYSDCWRIGPRGGMRLIYSHPNF